MRGKSWEHIINKKYGCLTVIALKRGFGRTDFECKCDCGNVKTMRLDSLTKHSHSSCGECYNGVPCKAYLGKRYGHLIVVKTSKKNAVCKCDCGNVKEIKISDLGRNTSCGKCYNGISYKDFIGKRYGHLTVVSIDKFTAECKCDCGSVRNIPIRELESGRNKTCGECYNGISCKDFIGKRYGHLVIVKTSKKNVVCKCDCGNVKNLIIRELESGYHKSCGECYNGISCKDFIGKRYGHLTVVSIDKFTAECKCDCGNIRKIPIRNLEYKDITVCGECYNGVSWNALIGKTFGYLTIKEMLVEKQHRYAICSCKCGNKTKSIYTNLFKKNPILSCGCLQKKIHNLRKISFGNLYVIKASKNNFGGLRYICKCTCGNEVEVLESDLFTGKVTCCKECLDLK